jgi:hypothetical protein
MVRNTSSQRTARRIIRFYISANGIPVCWDALNAMRRNGGQRAHRSKLMGVSLPSECPAKPSRFPIETRFLQHVNRVPDQAFETLDLGIALGQGRIVSGPLSDECPTRPVFVKQTDDVLLPWRTGLLRPLTFCGFDLQQHGRWLDGAEGTSEIDRIAKRKANHATAIDVQYLVSGFSVARARG